MRTLRTVGSIAVILLTAAAIIGWNATRFRGAEQRIRTKDLSFLPSADVGRALALGHTNTAARLRWIDSFAYFQKQLDVRDDSIAGGGSGFTRLYDLLIGLDPRFEPFYQHASLAVGALGGRGHEELGYLLRGTIEMPERPSLWRAAAAVLLQTFDLENRQRPQFEAFLAAWIAAMPSEHEQQVVMMWQEAVARRHAPGLDQLPYWLDRLRTHPDGPLGEYIGDTVREQLARYGADRLQAVADARCADGLPVDRIEDVIDPPRLAAAHIDLRYGPIAVDTSGSLCLRSDPYGYAYVLRNGRVESLGRAIALYRRRLTGINTSIEVLARADGRWLTTLAAVREGLGADLPDPPVGDLVYTDRVVRLDVPAPAASPWDLRAFADGR